MSHVRAYEPRTDGIKNRAMRQAGGDQNQSRAFSPTTVNQPTRKNKGSSDDRATRAALSESQSIFILS